jgi:hypothetical protein
MVPKDTIEIILKLFRAIPADEIIGLIERSTGAIQINEIIENDGKILSCNEYFNDCRISLPIFHRNECKCDDRITRRIEEEPQLVPGDNPLKAVRPLFHRCCQKENSFEYDTLRSSG